MNVYIVMGAETYDEFIEDRYSVVIIFSTKELAEKFVKDYERVWESLGIDEFELD